MTKRREWLFDVASGKPDDTTPLRRYGRGNDCDRGGHRTRKYQQANQRHHRFFLLGDPGPPVDNFGNHRFLNRFPCHILIKAIFAFRQRLYRPCAQ